MEDELKCPICRRLYTNPVFLPCSHALCLACALNIQSPASHFQPPGSTSDEASSTASSIPDFVDYPDVDKLSLVSETDSGVVCTSRPNSYVGTPNIGNWLFHSSQGNGNAIGICCPLCKRVTLLDEQGANSLPKNRVLENIVDKYGESKQFTIYCQLCDGDSNISAATQMCEQCEVFYCEKCLDNCHPSRGPLAKHNLVAPSEGKALLRTKHRNSESKCFEHGDEKLSMFCIMCKVTVCYSCVHEGRHVNHDVQALGVMCKTQKTELSQLLQSLSERARSCTEFIQRLKCMADKVQENCSEFEASVVAQCDSLIEAIKLRRQQLLDNIHQERQLKQRVFKEQVSSCTQRLAKTTGLIQFSIEVLKESDPSAFLQVSGPLINRISTTEKTFTKDIELTPRISPDFDLCLDNHAVLKAIQTLNFFQMKDGNTGKFSSSSSLPCIRRHSCVATDPDTGPGTESMLPPGPPHIIPDECSAENNTVTIAWQPDPGSHQDGFVLELDDGQEGDFREVYCGKENICTVEGLHFDSVYNARVKAFNHVGDSEHSSCVCLQTAAVAWFAFDPNSAHPDIVFSKNNTTVNCNSTDYRVVLGNVGFSRGVHYWEVSVDRYDNQPDPAIGVATCDVAKDGMLGKDEEGWSMYIDYKRSWFMHDSHHTDRQDCGVTTRSVIGVLLDMNHGTLSFYINGVPHGPIAFTGMEGVLYPAVSLNRNLQLTLHTGLEVPIDSETDE